MIRPSRSPASSPRRSSGQVARAVGGDPGRLRLAQPVAGGQGDGLRAAPGPDERERRDLRLDQRGEQVRGLGRRGPASPHLGVGVQQGRLPQGEGDRRAGRAVLGHRGHFQAGELARALFRVADGGRGEDEDRLRPGSLPGHRVVRGDAAQPAQDLGDVRAEDPAVPVALVDDDDPQAAEEAAPAGVVRQQPAVHHVRVGQQVVGVRLGPGPLGQRGVAVVAGGADPAQPEVAHRLELVGGQRLGRREVEHGAAVEHRRQGRREVAGRLAGGRPCGDDHVRSGPGEPRGLRLVRPRGGDPAGRQGGGDLGANGGRPAGGLPVTSGYVFEVDQFPGPLRVPQYG